ncbi:MAG: hypothetical protein DPW21_00660 [Anaerolineae bacterium]|mgnify:CR=1 FL=1|nr:hypothetical protein [Chloroflexi bacterium CFX2]MCQ3945191.1 hypothetical protein [Anaerolineae bacterium]HPO85033.1 TerB N-terminal domain-containing protein [Candidatus Hydrogenedentota bacterium]
MPKRSKKSNQGCCLVSLVIWPFKLLEDLINSIINPPAASKTQSLQQRNTLVRPPKRASGTDRFVDVTPGGRQRPNTPSIGVTISYENSHTNFVKEAQKFRSKEGKIASHVPFKCYWPTYGNMNGGQQQWYFYWRTQVRLGTFLPTDLSYIFVHVYEILNLVETPDPVQAADRLRILWMRYREAYPNLDGYLADWGGDLLAVKSGGVHALAWWENLLGMDGLRIPDPIINTIVEKAIRTNGLDKLPYKIWALLSDYQPKNKFYQRYNANHYVDLAYEKAIKVANDFYLQTSQKSLIDQFVSDRIQNYEKQVFTSAIIGYPCPRVIRLASGRDYAGSPRLAANITSIMKYAENLLRKQLKFSAKLSGVELPPELAKKLDIVFQSIKPKPQKPEPIRIALDPGRIATLHQESQVVSEMLATNQNSSGKALLTDLSEMRTLWKLLNNLERLMLAGLLSKELNSSSGIEQAYGATAEKVKSTLDDINNKASPVLGDHLVYEANSSISLAEDFIDELEVIVKESPPNLDTLSVDGADVNNDPWVQFFDTLEPIEVEITKILGDSGQLDELELDSIARVHNLMGNAVMDSLNEKAQETLSHLPFYPDGGYWLVEEDDLPTLRQYLGIEVN